MIPFGIIAIWNDTAETIPDGWIICDGNNETPDLQNYFVPSAGILFEYGDHMGAHSHDHQVSDGSHVHTMKAGTMLKSDSPVDQQCNLSDANGYTNTAIHLPVYKSMIYMMKI